VLDRVMILLVMVGSITACKTTSQQSTSNLKTWDNPEEREAARRQFTQALYDCVPLITAVIPGVKTITIAGDRQREAVVAEFVDRIIANPSSRTERSADLLQYYYNEKDTIFPPCGGTAAEYVLTEFATRTNALKVGFGEEKELRMTE